MTVTRLSSYSGSSATQGFAVNCKTNVWGYISLNTAVRVAFQWNVHY